MQVKCKYCGTRLMREDKYCPYCYARVNEIRGYREDSGEIEQVKSKVQTQNRGVQRNKVQNSNRRSSRNNSSSTVNRVIMVVVFVWIFMIFISIISNLLFFF